MGFDTNYDSEDDASYLLNIECWYNNLEWYWEGELSDDWFTALYDSFAEANSESWAGSDTNSWLLALASSMSQSMFIWQPFGAYVITWITLWLYTWHLPMKLGPKHLIRCVKNECCGDKSHSEEIASDLVATGSNSVNRDKVDGHSDSGDHHSDGVEQPRIEWANSSLSHKGRPLDLISLLGHPDFIIDDTRPSSPQNGLDVPGGGAGHETEMTELDSIQTDIHADVDLVLSGLDGDMSVTMTASHQPHNAAFATRVGPEGSQLVENESEQDDMEDALGDTFAAMEHATKSESLHDDVDMVLEHNFSVRDNDHAE